MHNNVFTFSKIECTNDKNNINSNSSKRSNSYNTNNKRKMFNNLVIEEEKNLMSLKSNDININANINNTNNTLNRRRFQFN